MASSQTDWGAAILRVALFPTQVVPRDLDVFTQFVGEPPDSLVDRPKDGIRRQVGTIDDATIVVVTNPARVDILAGTAAELGSEVDLAAEVAARTFGPFRERLDWFSHLLSGWLPNWELPTKRVSFIGRLLAPADSHEEAYKLLSERVQSLKIVPEMRDLLFRVNWRAPTDRVPERYYNRLTTWSALRLNVSAGLSHDSLMQVHESYFARVELDINTPAERDEPLPSDALAPIFQDLFKLAIENAEAGERP